MLVNGLKAILLVGNGGNSNPAVTGLRFLPGQKTTHPFREEASFPPSSSTLGPLQPMASSADPIGSVSAAARFAPSAGDCVRAQVRVADEGRIAFSKPGIW